MLTYTGHTCGGFAYAIFGDAPFCGSAASCRLAACGWESGEAVRGLESKGIIERGETSVVEIRTLSNTHFLFMSSRSRQPLSNG